MNYLYTMHYMSILHENAYEMCFLIFKVVGGGITVYYMKLY